MRKFTEQQINLLRGCYTSLSIKHKVDPSYVSKIANGDRRVNTKKASAVMDDLKKICEIFEVSTNDM